MGGPIILSIMSFIQELVKKQLKLWFPDRKIKENFKHPLLLGMEIDLFIPDFETAIEINGLQHYLRVKKFFKTQEDFEKQIKRDYMKEKILKREKIRFLPVKHRHDTLDVLRFKMNYLPYFKGIEVDQNLKRMLLTQWKRSRDTFFSNIHGEICKSKVDFHTEYKTLFDSLITKKEYDKAYELLLNFASVKSEYTEKWYSNLYGSAEIKTHSF